jgi:hypothetical protein
VSQLLNWLKIPTYSNFSGASRHHCALPLPRHSNCCAPCAMRHTPGPLCPFSRGYSMVRHNKHLLHNMMSTSNKRQLYFSRQDAHMVRHTLIRWACDPLHQGSCVDARFLWCSLTASDSPRSMVFVSCQVRFRRFNPNIRAHL